MQIGLYILPTIIAIDVKIGLWIKSVSFPRLYASISTTQELPFLLQLIKIPLTTALASTTHEFPSKLQNIFQKVL